MILAFPVVAQAAVSAQATRPRLILRLRGPRGPERERPYTKSELVINLKAAELLGLTIPQSVC